jgi:hypothetical protein
MVAEVARVNFNTKSSFIYLCLTQIQSIPLQQQRQQQLKIATTKIIQRVYITLYCFNCEACMYVIHK